MKRLAKMICSCFDGELYLKKEKCRLTISYMQRVENAFEVEGEATESLRANCNLCYVLLALRERRIVVYVRESSALYRVVRGSRNDTGVGEYILGALMWSHCLKQKYTCNLSRIETYRNMHNGRRNARSDRGRVSEEDILLCMGEKRACRGIVLKRRNTMYSEAYTSGEFNEGDSAPGNGCMSQVVFCQKRLTRARRQR